MKKALLPLLGMLLVLPLFIVEAQSVKPTPMLENAVFYLGEKYVYNAHYGIISAGEATVVLGNNVVQKEGRPCYHVQIVGQTTGMFSSTMVVKDVWTSYIDTATLLPVRFERDLLENRYQLKETTYFRSDIKKIDVVSKKPNKEAIRASYPLAKATQDMVSGYYYLRRVDFEKIEPGHIIQMNTFLEDSIFDLKIRYNGIKQVYTSYGKVKAYELSPILPDNDIFTDPNSIRFYISEDKYRVPLKIEADLFFMGAIEVDLKNHTGTDMKIGSGKKKKGWF